MDGEPSGEGRRVEGDELRIAGRARVERLLDRVAARLHAELEDLPALVGIRRRGFPLARLLARLLETRTGATVPVGELELKRYDDDLSVLHDTPVLSGEDLPLDLASRTAAALAVLLFVAAVRTLGAAAEALGPALSEARGAG